MAQRNRQRARKPPETKIVAGVATAAGHAGVGTSPKAQRIQQAMHDAVLTACEDGVNLNTPEGSAEIRERKGAARLAVLAEIEAEVVADAVAAEEAAAAAAAQ